MVHGLIDEWNLDERDVILDPFVGAGTTILAAKEKRIPAAGYDLSPLAVFASKAKIHNYRVDVLEDTWNRLKERLSSLQWGETFKSYPDLVVKALPGRILSAFDGTDRLIRSIARSRSHRDFFRLALIASIRDFSRGAATGGWLKWVNDRPNVRMFRRHFVPRVESMLADARTVQLSQEPYWVISAADTRQLPDSDNKYTAVITSPPYPNRHDYTRVFGVELMFGFLDWKQTRDLRYQSFHSHPEAHPDRPKSNGYVPPELLSRTLRAIEKRGLDPRVPHMLAGYFLDVYLSLREISRVCKGGARVAFIVGNAQYAGVPVLTDQITAEVGEQTNLRCERLLTVRYRGNSSQQMGQFGRAPSRESIVVFTVVGPTH